jgi:hypothetical protein
MASAQISKRISSRLRFERLRGRLGTQAHTPLDLIGCTYKDLASYLGVSVPIPSDVDLDHKVPLFAYELSEPGELHRAFNYKNMQLLGRIDNLRKGHRVSEVDVPFSILPNSVAVLLSMTGRFSHTGVWSHEPLQGLPGDEGYEATD